MVGPMRNLPAFQWEDQMHLLLSSMGHVGQVTDNSTGFWFRTDGPAKLVSK